MTTTIPTHIGKRAGALTKQREVACPTCHAAIGAFCVSVGQHGSVAGNIMPTSCHNARIIAAGLTPRTPNRKPKPADTNPKSIKGQRISRALKLSWAKRKAEEAEAATHKVGSAEPSRSEAMKASRARRKRLKELMNTPSIVEQAQSPKIPMTMSRLLSEALALLQAGAPQVDLSVVGVGEVIGHDHNLAENEQDKTYYTLLVKR